MVPPSLSYTACLTKRQEKDTGHFCQWCHKGQPEHANEESLTSSTFVTGGGHVWVHMTQLVFGYMSPHTYIFWIVLISCGIWYIGKCHSFICFFLVQFVFKSKRLVPIMNHAHGLFPPWFPLMWFPSTFLSTYYNRKTSSLSYVTIKTCTHIRLFNRGKKQVMVTILQFRQQYGTLETSCGCQ